MSIQNWYDKNELMLNELFTVFCTIAKNNGIDMYKDNDSFYKFLDIMYNNTTVNQNVNQNRSY